MPQPHLIKLQTGELRVSVLSARSDLDTLLTFGSRLNPKRRFLFVSKVLGKYVPCKPSAMRESYQLLAKEIKPYIDYQHPVWVLGVAETATGLGAGVAQEIKRLSLQQNASDAFFESEQPVIYSHTTRCALAREVDFSIIEAHSHAPSHLVYQLKSELSHTLARTAVIVDDEISTGKTLAQLTDNLIDRLPHLNKVIWVSLVNWISEEQRALFTEQYSGVSLEFCSLLDGTFNFDANLEFKDLLPKNTATGISPAASRQDIGRTGYLVGAHPKCSFVEEHNVAKDVASEALLRTATLHSLKLDKDTRYNVIGTGEFNYQAFLLAEQLQTLGYDVLFQSTGRSPAIEDVGIVSKLSCFDEGHQGMYYLYNLAEGRENILCYENLAQYKSCPFRVRIKAQAVILDHFVA